VKFTQPAPICWPRGSGRGLFLPPTSDGFDSPAGVRFDVAPCPPRASSTRPCPAAIAGTMPVRSHKAEQAYERATREAAAAHAAADRTLAEPRLVPMLPSEQTARVNLP
jgi:hypothetical protein